jgi:hypothetical protein
VKAVDRSTGEVIVLMDKAAALKITAEIKSWSATLWLKIEEAHRGQAWRALGYESWAAYLDAEFDISRSRGYQLVNHAHAVRALAAAGGVEDVSTMVDIPERVTRSIDVDEAAAEIAAASTSVDTEQGRVDLVKRTVTEHYEASKPAPEAARRTALAAIARDPEATNEEIAARTGVPLISVVKARAEINETATEPPAPVPDGEADAPEPAAPAAEADDHESPEGQAGAPSSAQGAPVDPPFDPVAYRDRGIDEELKVRRGLLTLDPDLLAQTDRRPEWIDLARDVAAWAEKVETACSGKPNLRSA